MSFYDLSKEERIKLVEGINSTIYTELRAKRDNYILAYFADEDTYIRKASYLAIGKLYHAEKKIQAAILKLLKHLYKSTNEKIRQTVINAAGEIGIKDFTPVESIMELGLYDTHHSVRNAVIGSIKKMSEKNPKPVLGFARKFLTHPDKEIRREICHGIELRGRKHPQDILPLLKELQHDNTPRVRNTLVHVLGQIAYKESCLETVVAHLKTWENKPLVRDALDEIVDVHQRYRNFSEKTQAEAISYIAKHFKEEEALGELTK
ncbi:MAG: HEAT repeat domain-containing protein [Bacteroidia bacterium]